MSSKTEDFPTPVSPTRRMVYDAFVLFFDILITPFLRDSTSLEGRSELLCCKCCRDLLDRLGVILVIIFKDLLGWASRIVV